MGVRVGVGVGVSVGRAVRTPFLVRPPTLPPRQNTHVHPRRILRSDKLSSDAPSQNKAVTFGYVQDNHGKITGGGWEMDKTYSPSVPADGGARARAKVSERASQRASQPASQRGYVNAFDVGTFGDDIQTLMHRTPMSNPIR